jgi:hypothetical protein
MDCVQIQMNFLFYVSVKTYTLNFPHSHPVPSEFFPSRFEQSVIVYSARFGKCNTDNYLNRLPCTGWERNAVVIYLIAVNFYFPTLYPNLNIGGECFSVHYVCVLAGGGECSLPIFGQVTYMMHVGMCIIQFNLTRWLQVKFILQIHVWENFSFRFRTARHIATQF